MSRILQGNCIDVLKTLSSQSINCCVTSPPYYGLRDYGVNGQIGLEETPEEYIDKLVAVFYEVKRVLKDDGTLWVNIGDSYWSSGLRGYDFTDKFSDVSIVQQGNKETIDLHNIPKLIGDKNGYKNKDLIGIPWMLAFALRKDGWYLRQDIIWHKPNTMPESVKDRCTKSHEYIFLLSKKPHYYFDYEAIQEDAVSNNNHNVSNEYENSKYKDAIQESSVRQGMNKSRGMGVVAIRKNLPSQEQFVQFIRSKASINILAENTSIKRTTIEHWFRTDETGFSYPSIDDWNEVKPFIDDWSKEFKEIDEMLTDVIYESDSIDKNFDGKRNKRDVWTVSPKPVKEAHFATFPEKLIEPCILAGCPKGGIVLDPFFGSGTTGRVATKYGREYIGIELNPEYVKIAERRNNEVQMDIISFM